MTKNQSESVGLHREKPRRRKIPVWLIIFLVLVLLVAIGTGWIYRYQIGDIFKPRPTELPEPPGQTGGDGSGILFQTTFDGDQPEAWQSGFDNGKVAARMENSQLVVAVDALVDTGTWLAMNYSYDDFVLDVDAAMLGGAQTNGAIVLFRMQDDLNYYRFDLTYDGFYAISKAVNGELFPVSAYPYDPTPGINVGQVSNHIQIWAQGSTFKFFVNGTQLPLCVSGDPGAQPIWQTGNPPTCLGGQVVQEWQDTTFAQGKIGLGAQGVIGVDAEGNATAVEITVGFDNLVIRTPEAAQ
jgi:hypothetical protein